MKRDLNLTPSLLDRLLDDDPKVSTEPNDSITWDMNMIIESVRQDLETLLNSRLDPHQEPAPDFEETKKSLVTYGLPDLASFHLKSEQDQVRMTRLIENVIRTFEPRLKPVRVKLVQSKDEKNSPLHFQIEGTLRVEPAIERVAFDTKLDLNSGEYKVEGLSNAG